jgi:hypothetical protein
MPIVATLPITSAAARHDLPTWPQAIVRPPHRGAAS